MKPILLLLSFFAFFVSVQANASEFPLETNKKSDIAGGVYHSETKKPINSVTVTAYSASKKEKTVTSDANGTFSFDDLKPGTYKFVFEKAGFKKITKEKVITRADEGSSLNVLMEEHPEFDFTPSSSHFFDFKD